MLKNLLLPVFLLAFVISVSAQHQRRVLIEEFTNASCGPCAAQNPAFNATVDANAQYLTPIKYQTSWPGVDPMNAQNPTEVQTRVNYYGVTGVPNGRENGVLEVFPMTGYNAATIQAAYNTLTPVTINLTHELTADFDSVILKVSVTSDKALTGTLRLRTAVTEKGIYFDAPPGSNGETEFFQVMRKMLPGAAGTDTGDFAAGETKSYEFAWPLAYIYDLNRISAVAWLQDDATKEVHQSAISEPLNNVPAVGIKIPPTNSLMCTAGAPAYFTLVNTAATPLTSASLKYKVGSGAWTDLNWTGDLAAGAATQVLLPDFPINASTNTKVQVEVLGSNNGVLTNMVSNTYSTTIRSLFEAPVATPLTNDFQSAVFPPSGWTTFNASTTNGWKLATGAGAGGSTRSARCNFYAIAKGVKSELITAKLDLTQATGVTTLKYDYAYAYYNASDFDSLNIQVSTDCGGTWTSIYHDGKDGLSTTTPKSANYVPAAGDWVPYELDLSAFNGNEIFIRFLGESGFGNNLYIDNLNVSNVTGVKELPLTGFSLQPNPARDFSQVRFNLVNPSSVRLLVFDAIGSMVESRELGDLVSGEHILDLDATRLNAGNYRVALQSKDGVANIQWVVIK